jgi:preprotein translocase subunit YajC
MGPSRDQQYNKFVIIVVIIMSEFAFFRFRSNNMLTKEEEKQHKNEIIELTEEVLESKGIEWDCKISKVSEKQLREILEEVRKLRRRRRKRLTPNNGTSDAISKEEGEGQELGENPQHKEIPYIR